uniref:Monofunctional biosynthetic peptidoglycan transglycosylase n=1 Tax=uncultured Bacteroidota bacterium TaxID=152509 RepID=H5SNX3_9BACT|nr:monofunctional biosynthetic peptidoglycan transglycosylase [uncultured Bacteroidetes bacterium]
MLLFPIRWLLRQVLGLGVTFLVVMLGALWALKWVPFPPLAVVKGFFSGQSVRWSWTSAEDQPVLLRRGIEAYSERPTHQKKTSLAERTAQQLLYWGEDTPGSAWMGLLLEVLWDKETLLTFYLNSLRFEGEKGEAIYGVGAASQYLYNKPLRDLSAEEIAELTVRQDWPYLAKPLPPPLAQQGYRLIGRLASLESAHAP